MIRSPILSAALLCAGGASAQDNAFGFEDAQAIGQRVVDGARANGRKVAVVVVNREGRVLVALRMDGTSFVNLELAERKAVSAAALVAPTLLIEQAVDGGKPSFLSVPGLAAIGGGIPLLRSEKPVGGVGVSGQSSADDEALAQAAIDNKSFKPAK